MTSATSPTPPSSPSTTPRPPLGSPPACTKQISPDTPPTLTTTTNVSLSSGPCLTISLTYSVQYNQFGSPLDELLRLSKPQATHSTVRTASQKSIITNVDGKLFFLTGSLDTHHSEERDPRLTNLSPGSVMANTSNNITPSDHHYQVSDSSAPEQSDTVYEHIHSQLPVAQPYDHHHHHQHSSVNIEHASDLEPFETRSPHRLSNTFLDSQFLIPQRTSFHNS